MHVTYTLKRTRRHNARQARIRGPHHKPLLPRAQLARHDPPVLLECANHGDGVVITHAPSNFRLSKRRVGQKPLGRIEPNPVHIFQKRAAVVFLEQARNPRLAHSELPRQSTGREIRIPKIRLSGGFQRLKLFLAGKLVLTGNKTLERIRHHLSHLRGLVRHPQLAKLGTQPLRCSLM